VKLARSLAKRVNDKARRAEYTLACEQAEVPLIRAMNSGHKFQYEELRANLFQAEDRISAVMTRSIGKHGEPHGLSGWKPETSRRHKIDISWS
jgi:hypothetical protein